MFYFLSQFSIRQQILIGYMPVFCFLLILSISNFQAYSNFSRNFKDLDLFTSNHSNFIETERDIMSLQRNILVYSYLGYKGVLKKIEFIQEKLEKKFNKIKPIAAQHPKMHELLERLLTHYDDYKKGFKTAIGKKNILQGKIYKGQDNISIIRDYFLKKEDFSMLYELEQVQGKLLEIKINIDLIKRAPDFLVISDTRKHFLTIINKINAIKENLKEAEVIKELDLFLGDLDLYDTVFKEIIIASRTYSHLINVVLPGKAVEIDKLSTELEEISLINSKKISKNILINTDRSKEKFILFILCTGVLGFLSFIIIARGISAPVKEIARTFSKLSQGDLAVEIPAQKRKDEVGEMAQSAHEFKVISQNLNEQTKELEEFTYRTYHDLRSPLVSSISLLGIADSSLNTGEIKVAQEALLLSRSSLIKLEDLTGNILELAKTKNFKEEVSNIDLHLLIDEALLKFSHLENFQKVQFQKELNFKNHFYAKKSRIELIVDNLISNAIKYQDTKKKTSFIKISTEQKNNYFSLSVEDNGLGIPKKYQEQLFNMFKRFHPNVSFGSGLGLYMMKKSADVLGGRVVFKEEGDRSIFRLEIPMKKLKKVKKNEHRIHNDHR